jgi:CheY-like chemotaxis protein
VQHVLVIGAEPSTLDVVLSALRDTGRYRVTHAASSVEALPLLERDRPSLAIIDSALADMPGLELAERARQQDVPVLLLTEHPGSVPGKSGFATLGKPLAVLDLIQRSRALIAESRHEHHLARASRGKLEASGAGLRGTLKQVRKTMAQIKGDARSGRSAAYDFRSDPILREALVYWHEKCGTRAMPMRRDIDAAELPKHLLPHLKLIDVIDGGERFYFRLVGTAIVEAFGGEFTGKYADEIIRADRVDHLHQWYRKVIEARRPVLIRGRYLTNKSIDMMANRLLMPLSQDGQRVNMILGALTFEFKGTRAAEGRDLADEATVEIVIP